MTVDGEPALLAVVTVDGTVVTMGEHVAREAEAVAVTSYRNFLKGQGFLRTERPINPSKKAA